MQSGRRLYVAPKPPCSRDWECRLYEKPEVQQWLNANVPPRERQRKATFSIDDTDDVTSLLALHPRVARTNTARRLF